MEDRMDEKLLYEPIKKCFEDKFKLCGFKNIRVEITANKRFSNFFQSKFGLQLALLERTFSPDITGYFVSNKKEKVCIIEVKPSDIKFIDIYQTKAYGDIFNANMAFLISPNEIPNYLKNFLSQNLDVLEYLNCKRKMYISRYDTESGCIDDAEWFPESPF